MPVRHPSICLAPIVLPLGLLLVAAFEAPSYAQENAKRQQQDVRTPNIGSFEEFLKKRLSDLPPDKIVLHATELSQRPDVDKLTGLVPPKSPFGPMEKLPAGDPKVSKYEKELHEFLQRRQQVIQAKKEYDRIVNEQRRLRFAAALLPIQPNYFATKVSKWNGPIFWSPASKTTDINLQFGDEARAVFGPIPPFDTTNPGSVTRADGWTITTGILMGEVDGNQIELKPNTSAQGNPLQFQHRDINGNTVRWTTTIDKCDKPSLAGGVTPCGTSSRLSRSVKGNVEWIALARKTKGVEKLTPDQYWMPGNSSYALIGYIGFNRVSGEVVFFDGTYTGMKFNWDAPTVPPGAVAIPTTRAGRWPRKHMTLHSELRASHVTTTRNPESSLPTLSKLALATEMLRSHRHLV